MASTSTPTQQPAEQSVAQPQAQRIDPNEELTQEKALSILIQSVNLAQSKGAYSFEEAELLSK